MNNKKINAINLYNKFIILSIKMQMYNECYFNGLLYGIV